MNRYPLIVVLIPLIFYNLLTRSGIDSVHLEPSDIPVWTHTYKALVTDYPVDRPKTTRHRVEILESTDTICTFIGQSAYIYLGRDTNRCAEEENILPTAGDEIIIRTRWKKQGKTISGYVRPKNCQIISSNPHTWYHPEHLRHQLIQRYRQLGFNGQELQTLSAMTLGYRAEMDRTLRSSFQRAGAAHVLAVSGLHSQIFCLILIGLLTCFGLRKPLLEQTARRVIITTLIILTMWGYALLTGMAASVVRCVIMLSIIQFGILIRRDAISINSLAAAAIIILIFRPSDLWSIGFWMSFMAVSALLLMVPNLSIHNKALRYIASLTLASLAAQIGTLPITMHYFGEVSNYFLLTNLIVVPLATIVISGGLASLALGSIPTIGRIIVTLTNAVVWCMNKAVGVVEALPGSVTYVHCSAEMMYILYIIIAFSILTIKHSIYWGIGAVGMSIAWCYLYLQA